jgi:hypothetical protein
VVKLGGGGLNALGRHTVAAYLDALAGEVDYDLSAAEVVDLFNSVFPGSDDDYEDAKNILAALNDLPCPLDRRRAARGGRGASGTRDRFRR